MQIHSNDLDEDEVLRFSLRGRILGSRVVIGTVDLATKDLIEKCPNASDGTFFLVRLLCIPSDIIVIM